MTWIETASDIRQFQEIAMIVSATLAIIILFIKIPHSEHIKKLIRAKNTVALSYLICAFTFGYTLYHTSLPDYEVFSALTMLIVVTFSACTLAFSLINLLNDKYIDLSRLLISIFAIFTSSIFLLEVFFNAQKHLLNLALIFGTVLFSALCIYYIIIFDKWYKRSLDLLEKYYDEDEEHKLKWIRFCFILMMLTNMFILVYLILPNGFLTIYIGFYILFLIYFASNFIPFLSSHKIILDAIGHWEISQTVIGGSRVVRERRKASRAAKRKKKRSSESGDEPVSEEDYNEIQYAQIAHSLSLWVKEKRYREYDKSREEIAAEIGTTKELLHQYFALKQGIDFRTWRTELRVEDAKKMLLEDPKTSINLIGEMAGFSDRSNFHRQFTKIVGCSPKQWRDSKGNPEMM